MTESAITRNYPGLPTVIWMGSNGSTPSRRHARRSSYSMWTVCGRGIPGDRMIADYGEALDCKDCLRRLGLR